MCQTQTLASQEPLPQRYHRPAFPIVPRLFLSDAWYEWLPDLSARNQPRTQPENAYYRPTRGATGTAASLRRANGRVNGAS